MHLCMDNNLVFVSKKTNVLVVDFRKAKGGTYNPFHINMTEVARVLVSTSPRTSFGPSTLRPCSRRHTLYPEEKIHPSPWIVVIFYRCTIDSILTNCITVWFVSDQKALQRVVNIA